MDEYIPEGYSLNDRYYLSVWLYTFKSFIEHPQDVVEFVEATFAFGDPFHLDLQLVANPHLGRKEVRRKFTSKAWEWCKHEVERGRLELGLTHPKHYLPPSVPTPQWVVTIKPHTLLRRPRAPDAKGFLQYPVPNELRFVIEFPSEIQRVEQDVQGQVANLARRTFVKIEGIYGFVHLSRRPPSADVGGTEYERRLGVFSDQTVIHSRQVVRGAFWENYLTKEHIHKLGGAESVKANAPCARVDELIPGRALALRLTEDISDVTPARTERLEQYFQPLAPFQDKLNALVRAP